MADLFQIGDKIVYPMHGAGVIEGMEEKEILGKTQGIFSDSNAEYADDGPKRQNQSTRYTSGS